MIDVDEFLFDPGRVVVTPGAAEALERAGQGARSVVARHLHGDWGDVPPDDAAANTAAVSDGGRILSAYRLNDGTTVWVLTEGEDDRGRRAATTILPPEEY